MINSAEKNHVVEEYRALLLDMPQQRSLVGVLHLVVQRLAALPQTALARIWLLNPADICAACPLRGECPQEGNCLHLVASAGNPVNSPGEDWTRLDGQFSRFPVGVRKVGTIAASGQPIEVLNIEEDDSWVARPEWVRRERIKGFLGQPLVCREEKLGVLALFTRQQPDMEEVQWLRMVADHAAMSIVNARAFEEINRLHRHLELERDFLRQEIVDIGAMGQFVGQSAALQNVVRQIDLVAPTDANVLVLGESGTGKELVAREIHKRSARRERPMIKVNCASIPKDLFESEFFGHVKGAFTGALKDRGGRFEAADGGTLFLDEVGEIPIQLQGKLLRVLQEGEFERVGEERTRKVNVRIIAATNRDLKNEVARGGFRSDLYYRLNVFPIEVAPLRERKEDILPLASIFLQRAALRFNRAVSGLTQADLLQLQNYDWPGNVRELQNVIERAVIVSSGNRLRLDLGNVPGQRQLLRTNQNAQDQSTALTEMEIRSLERKNIEAALKQCAGRIYGPHGAAQLLGLPPTTLSARVKKMGIQKPPYS
ncbi:sigma-54-dependent Fis family transcriptional regulator [Geoalkalibacter sp.]|uniref:sigma-54-dependent Fis family transcriptional regulator n=1 Tax=Geoalkalibacter sp. TaxID=3041440 RepID=UPI00272DF129|nr:sigma 54-interacting transcriptional regulator [Geoalkalibacter sp.]